MALPDLTGLNIEDTYPRLVHTDGANYFDGTGSLLDLGQNPRTVVEQVKNVSGVFLPKGTPVHATGSGTSGNLVGIIAADAGDPTKMPATYILNTDLDDEEEGEAIAVGYIQGVDTTGLIEGEVVYVAVGGGWTQTKPTGSALIQNLGVVTKVGQNGSGVVLGAGRSNDLPNIQSGYTWVGNSNGVPTAVPTSSLIIDPFPYTGSAIISGSLEVTGSITATNIIKADSQFRLGPGVYFMYHPQRTTGFSIGSSGNGNFDNGVSLGSDAGRFASGQSSISIGVQAGYRASYSFRMIAIGDNANSGNSSYSKTDSIGIGTYSATNGGIQNVIIGGSSGNGGIITNYSQSVFLGHNSGYSGSNHSVFLGYQSGRNEINSQRLHIANTGSKSLIYGEFDNDLIRINGRLETSGSTTVSGSLTVTDTITELSAERFKENIHPLTGSLEKANQLQGVSFNRIGQSEKEIGFIAEQVAVIFPELVDRNENDEITGVQYSRVTAILLESVKELSLKLSEMETRLERLENK